VIEVLENSLSEVFLSKIRDKCSDVVTFRFYLDRLSKLLIAKFFEKAELEEFKIDTPIKEGIGGLRLKRNVVFIPILRAGLSMLSSALEIVPDAFVGFIGTVRNEETLRPVNYYLKFPIVDGADYVLLDPMVATGGTSEHAVNTLLSSGIPEGRIGIVCAVCAPEGIKRLAKFKNIKVVTASVDERLNKDGYIVPGLGDAGDRFCRTENVEVVESYGVEGNKGC